MEEQNAPQPLVINLNGCARCLGDGHPGLTFLPFSYPVRVQGIEFSHWALCPTNGEPILLCQVETP